MGAVPAREKKAIVEQDCDCIPVSPTLLVFILTLVIIVSYNQDAMTETGRLFFTRRGHRVMLLNILRAIAFIAAVVYVAIVDILMVLLVKIPGKFQIIYDWAMNLKFETEGAIEEAGSEEDIDLEPDHPLAPPPSPATDTSNHSECKATHHYVGINLNDGEISDLEMDNNVGPMPGSLANRHATYPN